MATQSSLRVGYVTVDLKTLGNYTIHEADPRSCIVYAVHYLVALRTGAGSGADVSIGTNSTAYDNIGTDEVFGNTETPGLFYDGLNVVTPLYLGLNDGLKVRVTTASTYTSHLVVFAVQYGIIV